MKIRCDVCDQVEASVFCSADEAALCQGCDHRVHHANKLASKHMRHSLLQPKSLKDVPLCDICQERRAILFCREDRAILCRECDIPIHRSNEHTQKHNRFLLTGVRISAASSAYPTSSTSFIGCDDDFKTSHRVSLPSSLKKFSSTSKNHKEHFSTASVERPSPSSTYNFDDNVGSDNGSISTSSISEYLETLPGWRVDDLLDPSYATNGFNKTCDPFLPLLDQDLESYGSFCVPEGQVSPKFHQLALNFSQTSNGFKEYSKGANSLKLGRKWNDDEFTVPHISLPPLKKSSHVL